MTLTHTRASKGFVQLAHQAADAAHRRELGYIGDPVPGRPARKLQWKLILRRLFRRVAA